MRVQKAILFVKERFILMKKYAPIAIISILLVSLLAACSSSEEAAAENEETEQQPIIVEGPMPIEAEKVR